MVISVASGKGGTGKTLVATSLALSLPERVKLLDCDVEEPNAHIFIKPVFTAREPVLLPIPKVDEAKCTHCGKCAEVCAYNAIAVLPDRVLLFPELCHGCGACSYLCPEKAISEVGREIGVVEVGHAGEIELVQGKLSVGEALAVPITRKVKEHLSHEGINIIDVPPGTSCPVVEAIQESDFCLLVTEPTPFGLNDLALAVGVVRKLKIPCGVVINRAGVGDSGVEEYCLREKLPILLRIPLETNIAHLYSEGIPLVEGIPSWQEKFLNVFREVESVLNTGEEI